MFTGIVEETGTVQRVAFTAKSIRLSVLAQRCGRGTRVGDSIAVNGCCLTVVRIAPRARAKLIEFDLLEETWKRTNLQELAVGRSVNLERSLRANDRLGGHFVTGHIDGTGRIRHWQKQGSDWLLEVETPKAIMRYLVFKGAIALDGISLTVSQVRKDSFQVWIIPHTYEVTALRERSIGDHVNLEADILGKYVERLLAEKRL